MSATLIFQALIIHFQADTQKVINLTAQGANSQILTGIIFSKLFLKHNFFRKNGIFQTFSKMNYHEYFYRKCTNTSYKILSDHFKGRHDTQHNDP
jgi:hypothetical protein